MFFLAACNPGEELDIDALLVEAQEQVTLAGTVSSDITLPTTVVVDELTVAVSWSSSNTAVISNTGVVTRPSAATGNVSVTLTATFSYEGEEKVGTFVVIVEALAQVTFTITFNSNDGSAVASITANQGSTITAPTPPTKLNHTFGGWYKEVALTTQWNFTTDQVNANTTLYAKWVENDSYDVTFYKGNGEPDVVVSVYAGQKVTAITNPIALGYEFSFWMKADFEPWNFEVDVVTDDITLYAFYDIVTYSITYVLPEGAELIGTPDLTFDIITPAFDLGSAYLANHEFLGWFTAETGGTKVTSIEVGTTGNQTLYAQFEEDEQYTVTFNDSNGGITTETLYYGYVTKPTDPVRPGYTFIGWFKDMEGLMAYDFEFDIVSANITLYAKWEIVEYTITYHLNGGETANPSTYTIETPSITLLAATKFGYTFTGWSNAEVDGTIVTQVPLGTTGNLNFYAQYDAIAYTIDYMLDGGTLDLPNPTSYQITSDTITLNGASKEGYEFAGWFDAESEGILYTQISSGSTGNITLYARFHLLVTINFYGEEPVNIIDLQANSWYPNTTFALSDQNELFAIGGNDAGLLANGTNTHSNEWINITGYFGLLENEVILSVQLTDAMAVAHTSEDRIFIWGLFNIDEGMDIYTNEPLDVTSLFDFTSGVPSAYYNYGRFFLVETTDGRLLVYENMAVTNITPVLDIGETLQWTPIYGFGSFPYSTVIFTGSRILMLNPYDLSALFDMTATLNLPVDEDILAILSQEFAVHVLTDTKYTFATFTGDEMDPSMALSIDLEIDLNPFETLDIRFGGGGFITSEGRLLVPMYIVDGEEAEMPTLVKYYDVTSELMLEMGETIVSTFEPFFIYTSLGRLLFVMSDENFTEDPFATPELMVVDLGLDELLDETEVFLDIIFVGYQVYLHTNKGLFMIMFGTDPLELEPLVITSQGVVYSDIYSVNNLDNLYEPMDRMYEDFVGWYIDSELLIPVNSNNVYDGIELYPKWEKTHYFIEFQVYGSTDIPKMAVELGQVPTAPAEPIYDHMLFVGWYYYDQMENYQSYDFSYAIDFDVVLFAQTQTKVYNVTFQFETEESIVSQVYAYTYYGDLYIQVPEGYEVVAVYLDEDMLIPFDPDLQVLSDITLYVAIDLMTIQVYYYHDMEEVSFLNIFSTDTANYGFASDGRIFAWGSNYNGGLGVGFDHINDVQTPMDITSLFNLGMGEEISQTYAYFSYKVFITNQGRIFVWGNPDQNYDYYGTPQDITALFNFQMGEEVTSVYFLYNTLYIFTDLGNVYVYQSYNNHLVHQFSTTLTFSDVYFVEQYNYESYDIVVIIPEGAFRLASSVHGDNAVETKLNETFNDEVFKILTNFQMYNVFFVYTREGRVYLYDHNEKTLIESFDLSLNEFDSLVDVFEYSWDQKFYYTADGRLYKHLGEGVTSEFDLSLLEMGEKLLHVLYGSGFYTSFGNLAYIDTDLLEVTSVQPAFDLGVESVIYYVNIDFMLYAYTTAEIYITSGDPAMELIKTVGINLMIEQYVYGDLFELATPTPKVGYDFNGWIDDAQNPYNDTPVNDIILYASWSETIE
jgi:uncharacterized repeat protein (TIGR02543 family)